MKIQKRPTMLMILDGFGLNDRREGNAIAQADTPNLDRIFRSYPHTRLSACGLAVGLPEGQMGNSEVGHLNIGAGRVVYQELTRISKAIEDGDFFENPALTAAMDHALSKGSALHLLGLLSDGGVHSHISHLFALLDMAKKKRIAEGLCPLFPGRPRCAAPLRQSIHRSAADPHGPVGRRPNRHGGRKILRHGQRQTLGQGGSRLRLHDPGPRI